MDPSKMAAARAADSGGAVARGAPLGAAGADAVESAGASDRGFGIGLDSSTPGSVDGGYRAGRSVEPVSG